MAPPVRPPVRPSLRDAIVRNIRRIEQTDPHLSWRKVKDRAVAEARETYAHPAK